MSEDDKPAALGSQQKEAAQNAKCAFDSGDYETCYNLMNTLNSARKDDPVFTLNEILIEFIHRHKYKQADDFEEQLCKVAESAGISVKSDGPSGSESYLGQSIRFNLAVLYFYQRQYSLAESILSNILSICSLNDDLYENADQCLQDIVDININPTNERKLNRRIIFLLLECLLNLGRHNAVLAFCKMLLGQEEPSQSFIYDIRMHLRVFQVRAAVQAGLLSFAEDEITLLLEAQAASSDSFEGINPNILFFLQAQLYHLQDKHQEAVKRLVSMGPSEEATKSGSLEPALIWNNLGVIHQRGAKYQLSGVQLKHCVNAFESFASEQLPPNAWGNNNRGVHGSKAGLVQLGQKGLQLALAQVPLRCLAVSQHYAVLHNQALQLLFGNAPQLAFNAFQKLVQVFPNNPRLWYRLAECCVRVQNPDLLHSWRTEVKAGFFVDAVGEGCSRKLIMNARATAEKAKPWLETASQIEPTLAFAYSCLRNAVVALQHGADFWALRKLQAGSGSSRTSGSRRRQQLLEWAAKQFADGRPGPSRISGRAFLRLWSSVSLLAASVALALQNPTEAAEHANQLLGSVRTPGSLEPLPRLGDVAPRLHRVLAAMYAAEAYYMMGRNSEAAAILTEKPSVTLPACALSRTALSVPTAKEVEAVSGSEGDEDEAEARWLNKLLYPFPRREAECWATWAFNAAVVQAVEGNFEEARRLSSLAKKDLRAGPACVKPVQFTCLRMFMELADNNRTAALNFARAQYAHVLLRGRLFSPPETSVMENVARGMIRKDKV